ncbi:MAG TPA: hypothetical protein VMB81_13240 [Candidatus Sulfotelmatobacter sp.]|nr:hypothetical protein [Candidatus Sulfotelmatobacter sp.]
MTRHDEFWRNDVDTARVAAEPRCIAAAWLLAVALFGVLMAGPAVAALADRASLLLR